MGRAFQLILRDGQRLEVRKGRVKRSESQRPFPFLPSVHTRSVSHIPKGWSLEPNGFVDQAIFSATNPTLVEPESVLSGCQTMGDAAETIVNEPKSIRSGSTTIFIAIPTTVRTALRTVFELEKMVFNVVTTGAIVETMLSTTLTIVSTPETIRSGRCQLRIACNPIFLRLQTVVFAADPMFFAVDPFVGAVEKIVGDLTPMRFIPSATLNRDESKWLAPFVSNGFSGWFILGSTQHAVRSWRCGCRQSITGRLVSKRKA